VSRAAATRIASASAPRFVLVGVSNVAIGFAVVWIGVHLPFEHPLKAGAAQLAAYFVGSIWAFFWNRRWTFRATGASATRQAWRFAATQLGLALTTSGAMNLAVDRARLPVAPTWFAIMTVATVANFALSRYWVFRS
jgi:putative flippase GtrA